MGGGLGGHFFCYFGCFLMLFFECVFEDLDSRLVSGCVFFLKCFLGFGRMFRKKRTSGWCFLG